jgi:hypothetical protein
VDRPEASALLSTLEPGAPVGVAVHEDALRELLRSPSLDGVGIHDGARQALASGRALTGIARTIAALRETMVDLHPVAFDVAGLESALGAVAEQQAVRARSPASCQSIRRRTACATIS